MAEWTYLGVGLCLLGGVVDNVGVTLQKLSHSLHSSRSTSAPVAVRKFSAIPLTLTSSEPPDSSSADQQPKPKALHVPPIAVDIKSDEDFVLESPRSGDVSYYYPGVCARFVNCCSSCCSSRLWSKFYFASWRWLLGLGLFLCGNIMNAVGLSLAPQSIVATLGAVGLITNTLTSKFILKEKVTFRIFIGTCIIIIGSGIGIAFGSHSRRRFVVEELIERFKSSEFLIFSIVYASLFVIFLLLARYFEKRRLHVLTMQAAIVEEDDMSISLNDDNRELIRWFDLQLSIIYPLMFGVIGSFTQLFAKAASEMVKTSIVADSQYGHFASYLFFVAVAVCGISQIHFLNMGLRRGMQLIVVPACVVSLETFSVVAGTIFYEEFHDFKTVNFVLFPLSVGITFFGIYILTFGPNSLKHFVLKPTTTTAVSTSESGGRTFFRL